RARRRLRHDHAAPHRTRARARRVRLPARRLVLAEHAGDARPSTARAERPRRRGRAHHVAQRRRALPSPASVNTIAGVVARNAREQPDGVAFVEGASGASMTWAEYHSRSSAIAATLTTLERGARVALQIPDGPDVHAAMLGCEKAGVVAVGIGARAGE